MTKESSIETSNQVSLRLCAKCLDNILLSDKNDLSTCKVVDFGLSAKYKLNDGGMD